MIKYLFFLPSNNQFFQIQFRSNTHKQLCIKRIVMSNKLYIGYLVFQNKIFRKWRQKFNFSLQLTGFAVAPPAIAFIIGVSTSMNSRSFKYLRIAFFVFEKIFFKKMIYDFFFFYHS